MKSIEFEEANLKIAEHQEEFQTIHAYAEPIDKKRKVHELTMCFELNEEEKKQVKETGKIWLKRIINNQEFQPIGPDLLKPDHFK